MIHTFNKDDWSGEEATINFSNDKFTLNGEKFRLVRTTDVDGKFTFDHVEAYRIGEEYASATASKVTMEDSKYNDDDFLASTDTADIERISKHAEVAIAQVLFNIV